MNQAHPVRVFFDTNIPLYLLSADEPKSVRSEDLLADGGVIGVPVLIEFVAVARRKHAAPWTDNADPQSSRRGRL